LSWLALRSPATRPPSTETIERTPQRLARGEYLVEHLSECMSCHSDHDYQRYGLPVKSGTRGAGGYPFDQRLGVPGVVCAQNLTPDPETGKGKWTDGELMRAIREGVSRDGRAPIPPTKIDFPVNLLIKFAPVPLAAPIETPDDAKDHLAYGKYLTTIGICRECHSAHDDHGNLIAGREFAGGWKMEVGPIKVVTANITPHPDTFVGRASKEEFIARFKSFAPIAADRPPAPKGRNTLMPWLAYSGLTERDLGAIYDYLRTVPPIENRVDPFPEAVAAAP
jgi:hypothetical protein